MDAVDHFDLPHDGGQSDNSLVHAHTCLGVQLPLPHRLRSLLFLLERRQCQLCPPLSSIHLLIYLNDMDSINLYGNCRCYSV